MPSLLVTRICPGHRYRGFLQASLTPPVVPAAITSPGRSATNLKIYATSSAGPNSRSAIVADHMTSPSTQLPKAAAAGTSSGVTR